MISSILVIRLLLLYINNINQYIMGSQVNAFCGTESKNDKKINK